MCCWFVQNVTLWHISFWSEANVSGKLSPISFVNVYTDRMIVRCVQLFAPWFHCCFPFACRPLVLYSYRTSTHLAPWHPMCNIIFPFWESFKNTIHNACHPQCVWDFHWTSRSVKAATRATWVTLFYGRSDILNSIWKHSLLKYWMCTMDSVLWHICLPNPK